MDFVEKLYKSWKPVKIHKKVKLVKLCKKAKLIKLCKTIKPGKIVKFFKPVYRMLFPKAQPPQPVRDEDLAFMTCIIKVDASKPGWQRGVLSVLRNCRGARFKMDQNGSVEISALTDPNKLLKKLGRSSKVELQWFQFGQCSSNLFMPEAKKKPPPAPEKPNYNTNPNWGYNGFPPPPLPPPYGAHGDYPYPPPPQLLPPYYDPYQQPHRGY